MEGWVGLHKEKEETGTHGCSIPVPTHGKAVCHKGQPPSRLQVPVPWYLESLLLGAKYRMFPTSSQSERHTLLSSINFRLSKTFAPNSQSLFQCAWGIIMFSFSLSEILWGLQNAAFLFHPLTLQEAGLWHLLILPWLLDVRYPRFNSSACLN